MFTSIYLHFSSLFMMASALTRECFSTNTSILSLPFQVFRISINLTTHEQKNMGDVSYMKDEQGHFKNSYNRGFTKNWMEFLNLIPAETFGIDRNEGELFAV